MMNESFTRWISGTKGVSRRRQPEIERKKVRTEASQCDSKWGREETTLEKME